MPMSQAMCGMSSLAGRPRSPSRRGIARPAWSAVSRKSELAPGRSTRTEAGSPSSSSRNSVSFIAASVDFGIAGADLGVVQPVEHLELGPLESQVHVQEPAVEPLARFGAGGEPVERLAERARQWPHPGRLALGVAHVPEIAFGRRWQS